MVGTSYIIAIVNKNLIGQRLSLLSEYGFEITFLKFWKWLLHSNSQLRCNIALKDTPPLLRSHCHSAFILSFSYVSLRTWDRSQCPYTCHNTNKFRFPTVTLIKITVCIAPFSATSFSIFYLSLRKMREHFNQFWWSQPWLSLQRKHKTFR